MGDIAFLLIIFFMLASNFMKTGNVDLQRPGAPTLEQQEPAKCSVMVDRDGVVWCDGAQVSAGELASIIKPLVERDRELAVHVSVHKDLKRDEFMPVVEAKTGVSFRREDRIIGGFSMGGVTTWYAFLQALDLFYHFLPLSGDCWACGEKGGGEFPEETASILAEAVSAQGHPDFRIHAITGDRDIAYPNLDPQIRAMRKLPAFDGRLRYDVLEGGVHDYETIFRYLYNALPEILRP